MRELAGKVAVITGAANGIGRALARVCGAEGMKVVLADIDSEALDEAGAELARARVEGMAMTCDVAQAAEVEELANVAFGHFGAVHLLCNNAGVAGTVGPCWTIEAEEWDRDLAVNLGGVIHAIRAFVPRMLGQEGEAHIVNTASVMGLLPAGMAASYGVSKAGVVALSEALALELRQQGGRIGVTVLCPAAVATDIAKSLRIKDESAESLRAEIHADLQKGASAEEVARAALEAVRDGRFSVLPPMPDARQVVDRVEGLLAGGQPFAARF